MVTSKSRYVDEILVEKQGCCSPQEGLVDHPDIRQVGAWGKLLYGNLDSRCSAEAGTAEL